MSILAKRLLATAVTAAMLLAPVHSSEAAPRRRGKKAKAAATTTDGKTVALMRFTGPSKVVELRPEIQRALQQAGFTVKGVALDMPSAAKSAKCKGPPDGDKCLSTIGKWLNSRAKTSADFILFATGEAGPPPSGRIVLYDISKGANVKEFKPVVTGGDQIMWLALPPAVVTAAQNHIEPPPPATDAEKAIIAQLDEPERTPEEIQAEKDAIKKAEEDAAAAQQDVVADTKVDVNLRKDHPDYCREGKRRPRKSRKDPKDLRPKCQRGPFFGYWQPRAWVALGLTIGAAGATIAFYSLALAARGPYKSAVDDLDAYNDSVDGDPRTNPNVITNGDQAYDALATEVSRTGSIMRRRAIVGDVLLGTTALIGGVLAIIIFQDRRDAKGYIEEQKLLKKAEQARFRVGPVFAKGVSGGAIGIRF